VSFFKDVFANYLLFFVRSAMSFHSSSPLTLSTALYSVFVFFKLYAALTCIFAKKTVTSKNRDAKDTPLRVIPESVQPEADSSMDDGNDVQHMDVEGYQYANVQREHQSAANGRQVRYYS